MKKYFTDDGTEFEVNNTKELVDAMRADSWGQLPSVEAWMKDTAERLTEVSGSPVRYDTVDHFVADLVSAGVLKEDA